MEGKIWKMECNPETKANTITIDVEVDDSTFEEFKEYWIENSEIDVILNKKN